jgi:hypothetical protein
MLSHRNPITGIAVCCALAATGHAAAAEEGDELASSPGITS